MLYPWSIYWV